MPVATFTGATGALQTKQTSARRAGGPDGIFTMLRTIAGNNCKATGVPAGAIHPGLYCAETHVGKEYNWRYNYDEAFFVKEQVTTDGAAGGRCFTTLTNSGTSTLLSTQAGMEGLVLSTTGASSGNQNAWIATDGGFSTTNRIMWGTFRLRAPDPNVAAYDFWMGLFNKQANPGGTAPTDGAWFKCVTSAGAIAVIGQMGKASTTASTATLVTIASGVPQSLELLVVLQGQVGADFYFRTPSVAPTFANSDKWVFGASLSAAANLPTNNVILRPHLVHYTRTAATHAINLGSMRYGMEQTNALPVF